ncbi:fanconi-associated nuclease 1 [Xylocopa sonorina]|uniref:fanconi-associated nuclease 1 n=1 Tax=Xylocopa sonorina TaxID=1818115 RepID=UPI00403B24DA
MVKQTYLDQYYKSVNTKHTLHATNIKKRSTAPSPGKKRKSIKTSQNVSPSQSARADDDVICLDHANDYNAPLNGNNRLEQISQNVQRNRNSLNTSEINSQMQSQTTLSNTPVKTRATCNYSNGTPTSSPNRNGLSLKQSNNSFFVATSPENKRESIETSQNASTSQGTTADDNIIINSDINELLEICLDDADTSENDQNVSLQRNNSLEQISQNVQRNRNTLKTNEINSQMPKRKRRSYSNVKRRTRINNSVQSQTMLSNSPVKTQATHAYNNHLNGTPTSSSSRNDVPSSGPSTFSSTPRKSSYTFKVQSGQSPQAVRRKLFGDNIDTSIVDQSIEQMNLAKQNAIPLNSFNLEEIYSKGTFSYQYSYVNTTTKTKYESNDIIICDDLNPKALFTTVFNVLSNPVNCGYFDVSELDFIYSILTLPTNAQKLLARLIKRKAGWFRKSNINYPEIAEDLKDTFDVLVSRSICTYDIRTEDLSEMLKLLQVDEVRQLCQKMHIDRKGSKEDNIQKLLVLAKTKPLFPGMKDPSSTLYDAIFNMLEYCVRITARTWTVLNKIITLLLPNVDPKNSFARTFDMLCDIYLGKITYPKISGYNFPVFSNSLHLVFYIKAKSALSETLKYIEKKKWSEVKKNGNLAMDILPKLLETDAKIFANSALPMHVKRYRPAYTWLKILSKSVDAFKKTKDAEDTNRAVEILKFLLNQDCYLHSYKGEWYAELALIEMFRHKTLETSASTVLKALNEENFTRVDKVNLMERARKIFKRKTGVNASTKAAIDEALQNNISYTPKYKTASVTIDGILMPRNKTGNKSVWCIENIAENQSFGSVETVAFHYYRNQGYPKGLHLEGALPIALFYTLFWEELYDLHIPGVFVTPYSEAPGDLFTEQFYVNRKKEIDLKLENVSALSPELFSSWMDEKFQKCRQYRSVMSSNLQGDSFPMKEIVHCLGTDGVVGICKRLVENFKLWKAGFPDLIVWNYETKKHKIVEVKGPRDVLSTKQRLWLEYLHELELNIELCLVEDKSNKK